MPDHAPVYTYLVQVYDPIGRRYRDTADPAETTRYSGGADALARAVLNGFTAPFDLRVAVWEGDYTGGSLPPVSAAAAIARGR